MWRYYQSTGELEHDGEHVASGYAGADAGKNNPQAQTEHNVGPLPRGEYTIGAPSDTKTHGPYVLHLTPDPTNEMFGRAGFLIHGDSMVNPGTASEGCMIFSRTVREQVWESGDHRLQVLA